MLFGDIRDKSAEQLPQRILEESLCSQGKFEIQAIAVEFLNSTGSNHNPPRESVLNYVQSKQEDINKGGCQTVVLW